MNFAICNETFQDWPFDRAFAFAAECGYTGIEIAPFTIAQRRHGNLGQPPGGDPPPGRRGRPGGRRAALAAGQDRGLHLTSPDPAVRRKTADYLGELARLAADLGGRLMVFGSPQQRSLPPGVTLAEGTNWAAEVFEHLVPTLEATRVSWPWSP